MSNSQVGLTEREVDEVLLQAVGKGDREALEALYDRYSEAMLRYLLGMGCEETAARAILQRIFTDLWQRPNKWLTKGLLKPWLLSVAHKAWAMEQKPSARPSAHLPAMVSISYPPVDSYADPYAIRELLGRMPAEWHEVLMLSELGRLSYNEISQVLNISASETRLRKAAGRLRMLELFSQSAEHTNGASQFPLSDFLELNAYADGEADAAASNAMARTLDASDERFQWQKELLRMRNELLGLGPIRLMVPPFEILDRSLQLHEGRRTGFRARLAFEIVALIIAIGVAATAHVLGDAEKKDAAHYALYRLGLAKELPPLPLERPGKTVAYLKLFKGQMSLITPDGSREGVIADAMELKPGERLTVPEDASAMLCFPGGSMIVLRGGSAFRLADADGHLTCRLDRGSAWFSMQPSEGQVLIEAAHARLLALAGDFDVAIGSPKDIMKNHLAKNSRKIVAVQSASQPADEQTPSIDQAPKVAVRVTVQSGGVSAGGEADAYAVTGETLFVEKNELTIIDTPFGDASLDWSKEERTSPMYEAVSALAGSCQSLRSVIERKDPDIIGDALTPFLGLWPNIYVGTTAADYLTKSELQELADLRVKSVKVIKGSVVIDVVKKDSPESARLVMEKHEEAWRIKRQIGRLFPIDISKKPIKKGSDLPGETPELPWTFV